MNLLNRKMLLFFMMILVLVSTLFCDGGSSDGSKDVDPDSYGWALIDNADSEYLDEVYVTINGQKYDVLAELGWICLSSDEYILAHFTENPSTISIELVYDGFEGENTQSFNDISVSFGELYFVGWNHDFDQTQHGFRDPSDYQKILNDLGPERSSAEMGNDLPFQFYILKK